ncbi:MAG: tetratricopeptide repeat protein [Thiotrichaceae bacterium]|nr:tetratricopeptide repeat protein [Thiotrichaceae bacterium]
MRFLCKNIGVIILTNFFMGCAGQLTYNDAIAQETAISDKYHSGDFISTQHEYMYKILVAEMAKLRGNYALAAEYYFDVALKSNDLNLVERATQIAEYAQEYNIAMKAARLWLSLAPNNLYAHQTLVSMLIRDKRMTEAVEHLEVMLDTFKAEPQQVNLLMRAMLEQQAEQEFALKLIQKLIAKRPRDPRVLIIYARVLNHANQINKALEVLDTILIDVPEHVEAVRFYAYLLKKQGKQSLAFDWLRQALQKSPKQLDWRLMYARMLTEDKQFEKAIQQFKLFVSQSPEEDNEIVYTLGVLSLELNKLGEAKKYFLTLIENGEKLNTIRYYLGQIAQAENDLINAISWYRQVDEGVHYSNIQARIAIILVKQGKTKEAIEHLRTVSVSNQEDKLTLMLLEAELLVEQKRYQQALKTYERIIHLDYDNTEVLYMRAMLHEQLGNVVEFEKDLRRILALKPKNANALNALGYSLIEHTDRYVEAHDLIKQALVFNPNDFYILDSMGWVLYKMGKYTESIAYLRQAYEQRTDPEIAAHLGEVLWKIGDYRAAKEIWNKAVAVFPNDQKLNDVIHRFLPVNK